MPTLIGPVSEALGVAAGAAAADAAAGAALVAADGAASPGPLHPKVATNPASISSIRVFITFSNRKRGVGTPGRYRNAPATLSSSVASFGQVSKPRRFGVVDLEGSSRRLTLARARKPSRLIRRRPAASTGSGRHNHWSC